MRLLKRTTAAALIAGGISSLTGPAHAVPLGSSLSLRDASTSQLQTVQWRRWGWGGFGMGVVAGAFFGAALRAPYSGYRCYGCGYPAYYGYPYYGYAYSTPYYSPAYDYPHSYYPRYRYHRTRAARASTRR
jgi:hypothetical protein